MLVLIFALGTLLGLVIGVVASIKLVRHELTAYIAPRLETLDLRVSNLQRALANLDALVENSQYRTGPTELPTKAS